MYTEIYDNNFQADLKSRNDALEEKKENDDENIEFEISDELVKFYEESLKFQNQKSLKVFVL
jgi:hypothetical protein